MFEPMKQLFVEVLRSERGANLAEYGLLVLLIAIVAFAAVQLAGSEVSAQYSEIASGLVAAGS
jgi:Flp pilus assembly pilin Flp